MYPIEISISSHDIKSTLLECLQVDLAAQAKEINPQSYEAIHNKYVAIINTGYRIRSQWDEAIIQTAGFRYFIEKITAYDRKHGYDIEEKVSQKSELSTEKVLRTIHPAYDPSQPYELTFSGLCSHLYSVIDRRMHQQLFNSLTNIYFFHAVLLKDSLAYLHWLKLLALLQLIAEVKNFSPMSFPHIWLTTFGQALQLPVNKVHSDVILENNEYLHKFFETEKELLRPAVRNSLRGLEFASEFIESNPTSIAEESGFAQKITKYSYDYLVRIINGGVEEEPATHQIFNSFPAQNLVMLRAYILPYAGNFKLEMDTLKSYKAGAFNNHIKELLNVMNFLQRIPAYQQQKLTTTVNYFVWKLAMLLAADNERFSSLFHDAIINAYARELPILNFYLIQVCRAIGKFPFSFAIKSFPPISPMMSPIPALTYFSASPATSSVQSYFPESPARTPVPNTYDDINQSFFGGGRNSMRSPSTISNIYDDIDAGSVGTRSSSSRSPSPVPSLHSLAQEQQSLVDQAISELYSSDSEDEEPIYASTSLIQQRKAAQLAAQAASPLPRSRPPVPDKTYKKFLGK